MHLRENYIECRGRQSHVGALVAEAAPRFALILRRLARLDGAPAATNADLGAYAARRPRLDAARRRRRARAGRNQHGRRRRRRASIRPTSRRSSSSGNSSTAGSSGTLMTHSARHACWSCSPALSERRSPKARARESKGRRTHSRADRAGERLRRRDRCRVEESDRRADPQAAGRHRRRDGRRDGQDVSARTPISSRTP